MRIKFFIFISIVWILISCKSPSSDLNVIEGRFVDEKYYPTVVKINLDRSDLDSICSGIIVSENVILTAAHCLVNIDIEVDEEQDSLTVSTTKYSGAGIFMDGSWKQGIPLVLPEYERTEVRTLQDEIKFWEERVGIESNYIQGLISRADYETFMEVIKPKLKSKNDLGVIIFDNIDGVAPFKSKIEEAKRKGTFFSLSKNSFSDGTVLDNNGRSVFFMGYGCNPTYEELNNDTAGKNGAGTLQQGYNSVKYSKSNNEWFTPRPSSNSEISSSLYKVSNARFGDSGGPLIYKNKIIGVTSYGEYYDCDGNALFDEVRSDRALGINPETKKLEPTNEYYDKICYIDSHFTSITLGADSKIAESFITEVYNKLSELNLLKNNNNSIFEELLK